MKKLLWFVAVTGIAMAGYAQEQDTKYYVGLGYQTGTLGGDEFVDEFDQSQGGYVSFGSRPLPWLAVEARLGGSVASYDMSVSQSDVEDIIGEPLPPGVTLDSAGAEFTYTGINVDLLIKPAYQIDQFSVYGIAGVSFISYELEVDVSVSGTFNGIPISESVSESESDSDFGYVLGGGAAYDFGQFGINAEISTYQYGDFDLTPLISIGGTYNF